MEKRYIEKNKLKAKLRYYIKTMGWGKEWNNCLEAVIAIIDNQEAYAFQIAKEDE